MCFSCLGDGDLGLFCFTFRTSAPPREHSLRTLGHQGAQDTRAGQGYTWSVMEW